MTRNGLRIGTWSDYTRVKTTHDRIAECAYYLWLNGSEDTEKNWLEAENEILG